MNLSSSSMSRWIKFKKSYQCIRHLLGAAIKTRLRNDSALLTLPSPTMELKECPTGRRQLPLEHGFYANGDRSRLLAGPFPCFQSFTDLFDTPAESFSL